MSKSIEEILTEVIKREGEATNDSQDGGGRTEFGISERANPEAWADGKVTEAEARAIYETKYVKTPHFDLVQDAKLREQLIDYGVNSGPQLAVMELQKALGNVDVDGVLGPQTLATLDGIYVPSINNRLVIQRVKMFGRIVKKDPSQLKYLNGWLNRALEFIL